MAEKKAAIVPTGNEHAGELLAELAVAEASLREKDPESDLIADITAFHRRQAQTTPAQARALLERINEALDT